MKSRQQQRAERLAQRDRAILRQEQIKQDGVNHQERNVEQPRVNNLNRKPAKGLQKRLEMMEAPLEDGAQPSARVIKSSNRQPSKGTPIPHPSEYYESQQYVTVHPTPKQELEAWKEDQEAEEAANECDNPQRPPGPSVIVSESIVERPSPHLSSKHPHHTEKTPDQPAPPQRISRFKQRSAQEGFPSLDIPLGSLSRRGRIVQKNQLDQIPSPSAELEPQQKESIRQHAKDASISLESDSILNSMSSDQIKEEIHELQAKLSPDLIAFMRERGQQKKQIKQNSTNSNKESSLKSKNSCTVQGTKGELLSTSRTEPSMSDDAASKDLNEDEFYKMLASIQSPQELQEAFDKYQPDSEKDKLKSMTTNNAITTKKMSVEQKEFETATALLRSSSSKQQLLGARTIQQMLEQSSSLNLSFSPYLPVSLRCLLDSPNPRKHAQLHSYVLRSLYTLVTLTCDASQLLSMDFDDGAAIYQKWFMDDAVPSPNTEELYPSAEATSNMSSSPACYVTGASSQSAQSDGKSFFKDPLWTLLSKMRIIPCLSSLIRVKLGTANSIEASNLAMPPKTFSAVCGLLSMLSSRMVGSARAIIDQPDIIPLLVNYALEPQSHADNCSKETKTGSAFIVNVRLARPCLLLLGFLARQSRHVASTRVFADVIPRLQSILGVTSETEEEIDVQRLCLILWRTLLRYAFAIPHLNTFVMLASDQNNGNNDLMPEYLSSFAVICNVVGLMTNPVSRFDGPQIKLTMEQRDALAIAGMWFTPHVQQCRIILAETKSFVLHETFLKSIASRLKFLTAFLKAAAPANLLHPGLTEIIEDSKYDESGIFGGSSFLSVFSVMEYVPLLQTMASSPLFSQLMDILVGGYGCDMSKQISMSSTKIEALTCSVVKAFLSAVDLAYVTSKKLASSTDSEDVDFRNQCETLCTTVYNSIITSLSNPSNVPESAYEESFCSSNRTNIEASRKSWLNQAMFEVISFLENHKHKSTFHPILFLTTQLLGNLQVGDEFFAVSILSRSSIFQISESGDPLQRALLRELVGNPKALQQLEHSSRLWEGGETSISSKTGSFGLTSLRRVAEREVRPVKVDEEEPRLLLPVGSMWLWHAVSSTIAVQKGRTLATPESISEACSVLKACLRLLISIDVSKDNADSTINSFATKEASRGSKLYHLSNICLYPEQVLRDDDIQESFSLLFESNWGDGFDDESILSYINACCNHAYPLVGRSPKSQPLESDDGIALLQSLAGNTQSSASHLSLSNEETQSLRTFVGDICQSFLEYGAQYTAFLLPVRALLHPSFPPEVTCKVLEELSDVLHLLSTDEELADKTALKKVVASFLQGGIPKANDSGRDPPEVLDAFAKTLKSRSGGNEAARTTLNSLEGGGVVYALAIAKLARNWAASELSEDCSSAIRKRLLGMPKDTLLRIAHSAKSILRTPSATAIELSCTVVEACLYDPNALSNELDLNDVLTFQIT